MGVSDKASRTAPSVETPRHADIAKQLQPWLDLANLLPATASEVAAPAQAQLDVMISVFQRAKRRRLFFTTFAELPAYSAEQQAREFYEIFYAVRSPLDKLVARSIDNTRVKPVEIVEFGRGPLTEELHVIDGRLRFRASLLRQSFQGAFTGVELARIRRCPVCTGFYYAVRANKGACDKHLVLARTWKIRKKTPEYRENWQINKLMKSGRFGSRLVARAVVASRRRSRNSTTGGD
jgi:hypothetical protein